MNKILILSAVLLVVVLGLFSFYPQLSYYIATKAKFSKETTPKVYLIPAERVLKNSANKLSHFVDVDHKTFSFKSPWGKIIKKMSTNDGVLYSFKNEKLIILHHRKNNEDTDVEEIFGSISSGYHIIDLPLSTTPDDFSPFDSLEETKKKSSMLVLKALYTSYGEPIYKFSSDKIRGFQFGDPEKNKKVLLVFFDETEQEYRMSFFSATQDEIDLILSNIEFRSIE